jgi:hypothetical protein
MKCETHLYPWRRNDELARVEEAFIRILGVVSVPVLLVIAITH